MITWITENVAIGEYLDVIDEDLLKREKIDCVLNLRFTEQKIDSDWYDIMGIDYYKIPTGYYPQTNAMKIELRTAAYMLEQLTEEYKRILVHCTAGIDRAPFVVAYWIVTKSNEYYYPNNSMSKEDFRFCMGNAYKFIKGKRPQIIEHYEWI